AIQTGGLISFACNGTITLTQQIVISRDTTVNAAGRNVFISGGDTTRLFWVTSGVRLTLTGLTLQNGRHVGSNATISNQIAEAASGGAIFNDGGHLELLDCTLKSNSAIGGHGFSPVSKAGAAMGGAVCCMAGSLTV